MRRYLVCSDIHGYLENFISILSREHDVCAVLVAGDIEMKTAELMRETKNIPCYVVRGNCDYDGNLPTFTVFQIGTHKVYAAHGHRNHVSFGTENLEMCAMQYGCDIAMYGHTHVPDLREKEKITVLNPGSISLPRQTNPRRSYVVMTIDQKTGKIDYELKFL